MLNSEPHSLAGPVAAGHLTAEQLATEKAEDEEMTDVDAPSIATNSPSPFALRVDNDSDSAIGDVSVASSTASLSSTLYEVVEENGRTYHKYKEGSYLLPNDELEQNRLDLQHHLWKVTLHGRLFLAPIKDNPQNILDFGTGTGIWAIEVADKYPSANVLGTDLSPIQPLYVPSNCRFEVDDAEDEWIYAEKFDFIHGRAMAFCFHDPPSVFQKAFHACAPGGYFQMADAALPIRAIDSSLQGTALLRLAEMMVEGMRLSGKDVTHAPRYKAYMEAAGFVDVVEERFQWPTNTWPKGKHQKTLGDLFNQDMQEGLSGIVMGMCTRVFKMKAEEVEALLVDVKRDLNDRSIHAYQAIYVVYGRKPE